MAWLLCQRKDVSSELSMPGGNSLNSGLTFRPPLGADSSSAPGARLQTRTSRQRSPIGSGYDKRTFCQLLLQLRSALPQSPACSQARRPAVFEARANRWQLPVGELLRSAQILRRLEQQRSVRVQLAQLPAKTRSRARAVRCECTATASRSRQCELCPMIARSAACHFHRRQRGIAGALSCGGPVGRTP